MSVESLVLLSGGLDSMVLAHQLIKDKKKVRGVFFDFGSKPTKYEKESAKKVAYALNIPLEIADLRGVSELMLGYVPLEKLMAAELDVVSDSQWPICCFISGFTVPLSIATYYAQVNEIADIQVGGVIGEQKSVRPKLDAYFSTWPETIKLLNNQNAPFSVSTPFLEMDKADVVKLVLANPLMHRYLKAGAFDAGLAVFFPKLHTDKPAHLLRLELTPALTLLPSRTGSLSLCPVQGKVIVRERCFLPVLPARILHRRTKYVHLILAQALHNRLCTYVA